MGRKCNYCNQPWVWGHVVFKKKKKEGRGRERGETRSEQRKWTLIMEQPWIPLHLSH